MTKEFIIMKSIYKLPNGNMYTIGLSDEFLEEQYNLPSGFIGICGFGVIFTTLFSGDINSTNEVDRYPCIILPEHLGITLSKEECLSITEHELGHLYVPGALGIETDIDLNNKKECLADTYVSNPSAMISFLEKLNYVVESTPIMAQWWKDALSNSLKYRIVKLKNINNK